MRRFSIQSRSEKPSTNPLDPSFPQVTHISVDYWGSGCGAGLEGAGSFVSRAVDKAGFRTGGSLGFGPQAHRFEASLRRGLDPYPAGTMGALRAWIRGVARLGSGLLAGEGRSGTVPACRAFAPLGLPCWPARSSAHRWLGRKAMTPRQRVRLPKARVRYPGSRPRDPPNRSLPGINSLPPLELGPRLRPRRRRAAKCVATPKECAASAHFGKR